MKAALAAAGRPAKDEYVVGGHLDRCPMPSITVMEIVDNAIVVAVPIARRQGHALVYGHH